MRRSERCAGITARAMKLHRRIEEGEEDEVEQGELGHTWNGFLDSNGASDCILLGVAMELPDDVEAYNRWLLHFEATETEPLERMKAEIADSKSKGAHSPEVKVVYTDPQTQVPDLRSQLETDIDTVLKAAREIKEGEPDDIKVKSLLNSYSMVVGGEVEYFDDGEWMTEEERAEYDEEMGGSEGDQ